MATMSSKFAAVCLLLFSVSTYSVSAITDADILNFALNLECLEATFYSFAAYGHGLSDSDRGGNSSVAPKPTATEAGYLGQLSPYAKAFAADIASDEIAHVRFLRAALGGGVPCPEINVRTAFNDAAKAAFGVKEVKPAFLPYNSDVVFYLGAYIFEDVGVTAYKGAIKLLSDAGLRGVAAGFVGTEAYHAGAIRSLLFDISKQYVFPYKASVSTVAGAISALRQAAGFGFLDEGIVDANGTLTLVPADSNAITISRNTSSVLSIVYLGGKTGGGFFPKGVNGVITTV